MLASIIFILGSLSPPIAAITCGSTTPINSTTTLTVSATGPTNCNITFTAQPGFIIRCAFKLSGSSPTCSTDKFKFLINGTLAAGPLCGTQNITASSTDENITFNYIIASSANSLICSIAQLLPVTTAYPQTTTPLVTPKPNSTCSCGVNIVNRIINGVTARSNSFPWQVRLKLVKSGTTSQTLCGGTLISANYVLTAAHCVTGMVQATVYLGDQTQSVGDTYEKSVISKILVPHSLWNPSTIENDIALIKLPAPIVFSNGIQPACLPFRYFNSTLAGSKVTVTGWGLTSDRGSMSNVLLKTNMTVLSNTECSAIYGPTILPSHICTWKNGTAPCQGDSGGPLGLIAPSSVAHKNVTFVVGVVSFGHNAGCKAAPSVFTRVTGFLNWIQATTKEQFCNI